MLVSYMGLKIFFFFLFLSFYNLKSTMKKHLRMEQQTNSTHKYGNKILSNQEGKSFNCI